MAFDPSTIKLDSDVSPFDPSSASEFSEPEQDSAIVRGAKRAINSTRSFYNLATGDADKSAELAADRAAYEKANPGTQAGNELMAAWQRGDGVGGGIKEVTGEIAKDWRDAPNIRKAVQATSENLSAMGGGIVEQIPNMVAPMVGMGAGALAGAPAGPVGVGAGMFAGASVGNTAMESAEKVDQAIRAAGIDPSDRAAVSAFLAANGDKILGQAAIKGGVIGAVDTATMKLGNAVLHGPTAAAANRAIKALGLDITDKAAIKAAEAQIVEHIAKDPILAASKVGINAIGRDVAAAALEPAGEFTGEYVGEGLSTGDWDTKNAALEALSAIGQGAITYAGQKSYQVATDPLRSRGDAAPAGDNPATEQEVDDAIAQSILPMDRYVNTVPGAQARIGFDPDSSVIQVPTQAGGTVAVDRNAGPLSAAVVDTMSADMLSTKTLLRSYPNQAEAMADLESRPDANRFTVGRHPRSAGRWAVLPRSASELASLDAAAAATTQNQARQAQLADEEGPAVQSIPEKAPNVAEPAQVVTQEAPQNAAQIAAHAREQDAAEAELAPVAAQPVSELPGVRRIRENRAQQARAAAESRGAQLADDEITGVNTEPSEAQKAAGNYQKGHVKIGGLSIAIENPAGSSRSGIEGKKGWTTKMAAHYGYVKRTMGNDGDQVDVYVKPNTATDHTGPVFVVDQFNPSTGQFDEHKSFIGYRSAAEAQAAYDAHFSDGSGPKRRKGVTEMSASAFKDWAQRGDTSRPAADARTDADLANEEIAQSTGAKFARKRGESAQAYHQRMADESNERKRKTATSAGASKVDDVAVVREALGDAKAPVTIVDMRSLPSAGTAAAGQVSRQSAAFMTNLARMFNKQVVFVESLPADGFYLRGNKIYLATRSSVHHLRLMGHEMLHALRRQTPRAYQAMLDAVSPLVTQDELRAQFRDYFSDKSDWSDEQIDAWLVEDGNASMITEEWLADLSGNRFAESEFWDAVFQKIDEQHGSAQAKGIIAQLRMAITNALNKLMSLVSGNKFAVDARVADSIDEIREAIASGFAQYAKAVKDGQAVDQEEGKAKFAAKKAPGSDNGHKRTKDGDYVGAPAGMTPAKLGALRTRLRALAKEGEPGRFWYEESSDLILAAAEGDKALAEKIAGLLAIYSPQATVSANTSMGLKGLYQWTNGDPIRVRFAAQDKKATAWMDGTMGEDDALQIKTGNFFKNLMRKIDEDRYGFEKQGATIDMWMARVFGYGTKAIGSDARYYFAERETKRLADELGWEPQQVQAALWVAIKSRIEAIDGQAREIAKKKGWVERKVVKSGGKENISWPPLPEHREKYEGLILKMALDQEADPPGLTKAAYHFGTALRERVGQVSWEAMPGKTTGVLPGIFDAPLEQQVEYLNAMDKALRDETGQDLIAKKLGLPVLSTAMGPSAWQMNVGAGAQTEVAISTERDQGNKKVSVSAPARNLLNTYAAIRGYVLAQEAVVWHFPIFSASKKNANGIQLDFGRDPSHDEVVSFYNAIREVSGREDWAPAYVPGVGVRVLNFSDVPNLEFHELIKKAAAALPGDVTIHVDVFQSDGDYISNDWKEKPNGEDYRSRIGGSGRPDLQGWVESELRPRAERVNQEFAEKYGWGRAKFSSRRSDASRDEWDRGLATQGSGEVRSYGTSQPGSVSVQGIHYSQQERTNLDGRYYGTGMRGAEGPRVRAAADPRLKERVYFYVSKGAGVQPEDGVGAIAHTVRLNNVYDGNADTWVQAKVDRSLVGDDWMNGFESAVIDNGFDGYVTDFGTQRAVVLLGRHNVPVSRLNGHVDASTTKQAEPTPVTDRVAGDRKIPSGRMSGAEWKAAIPEATMLDDGSFYYKDDVVGMLRKAKLSTKRLSAIQSDLFSDDFATKDTVVSDEIVVSSKGAKEVISRLNVASDGRMIAPTKVALRNFWNWFGESETVDASGRPVVFYHTTVGDFSKFEANRPTKNSSTFGDWETTRSAIFFTDTVSDSEAYGTSDGKFKDGANVIPVFLKADRILDFTSGYLSPAVAREFDSIDFNSRWLERFDWSKFDDEEGRDFVAAAKRLGYDGVYFWDDNPDTGSEFKALAIFDPEQIKSATGNIGTFDGNNPDIRRSLKRRIDNTIQTVDAAMDGLSNLPGQFDYLRDRYLTLGRIARVDEITKEVRQAFKTATPTDKKAAYDYLTTKGATTRAITDPALRSISERIKKTINYTGDQLVARGLLDQQARDHYRDQYLPRMYLRHLLDDNSAKVIGMGKKPSDLGYLKHRKDIPVEIREVILGEVKDPSFLSVSAIGRAMRDISLMDWMGKISQNNDWVFPDIFVNWSGKKVTAYWLRAEADRIERQSEHYTPTNKQLADAKVAQMRTLANQALGNLHKLDHKKYKQIPDTMRYGLLRGMWVRSEIFNDIMGASQVVNADPTWFEDWFGFGGKGTKLTQWWKFTKVALNPPGQIRNFVSNMVMLQLSGVGLHKLPLRLIEAARDISSNGPYWQVAKKYGVTESTFTAQELFRVKRDLLDLEARSGKMNPLRFVMSAGASFLEKVSDLYQFTEALGKTIKIIDEMKAGKSEAEAALEAQKWLFDYSLVPQSVRIARNAPVGMPFLTYQIKVLPRLLEVAAKHPWRFLPWAGLLYGMQAAVAQMFGVDDDELKKLKKALPEWLQDRGHTVFLPMRDGDGRVQVADVGYFFPWTYYSQIGKHAAEGKIKKVLVDDVFGMFSAPIIGSAQGLMLNYDSFTHRPVYNETDPTSYQAAAIANYAYDLMAPPFLSSHGFVSPMGVLDKRFGGKMVQAVAGTTNKFGDPKASEAQAIGAVLGFNFYGMDPEHTRITNMQVMNAKLRDLERGLKQRLFDRGLSQEDRAQFMADYQKRMVELQQEAVEYAKESEVPEQLRVLKAQ